MDGVTNQHGRATLPAIVIMSVLMIVALGSLGMNYFQYQQSSQERRLLKGEITDLRYQVKQDQLAAAGSQSPSPTLDPVMTPPPTTEPTPTPAAVLGAEATPTPAPARTATTKSFVRMRSKATTSSAVVAGLNKGTTVTLGSFSNAGWQEVTVDGKHGYVSKSYLIY